MDIGFEYINENDNQFPESIIENRYLLNIIFLFLITLFGKERVNNYLSNSDKTKIKNEKILLELSQNNFTENMKSIISQIEKEPNFTIEYYQYLSYYLENITKKKEYFPDLLEFCIINA